DDRLVCNANTLYLNKRSLFISMLFHRIQPFDSIPFYSHTCHSVLILCVRATADVMVVVYFFFQAEDGIRDWSVTGVQTCALPISTSRAEGVNDRGLISGEYEDQAGVEHGYTLDGRRLESFDFPDSLTTDIWMVSKDRKSVV